MLKLYNTESRKLEEISPQDGDVLKIYACGPTVYNYAHIGNLRTYVFEDLLVRTLHFFNIKTKWVMNITDIDDKTIKGAIEKNQSLKEYTKVYEEAFYEDLKTLHILPADHYTRATDFIPEMIKMIETLIEKGFAYQTDEGNVFFSIKKFPSYGRLSHLKLDDLKANASERTSSDEYEKENVSDFVLWKAYVEKRDGPCFWESPFGKGRPGWHIECSAMALESLGAPVDLHLGGQDNIFPHHDNEIAQSEACTSIKFVRHWAHSEHLIVDGKKMSKSLNNFYTLRDLLDKGYSGDVIRYALLASHYRTQLNFTFEGLEAAKVALGRFEALFSRLQLCDGTSSGELPPLVAKTKEAFSKALADDLGIAKALAALFDFLRALNTLIDQKSLSIEDAHVALEAFKEFDGVLACLPLTRKSEEIPDELKNALQKREEARSQKDWALADEMRDFIHSKGYVIEDSPDGTVLKRK